MTAPTIREVVARNLRPGDLLHDLFGGPGYRVLNVDQDSDGRTVVAVRYEITFESDQPVNVVHEGTTP